MAKNGPFGTPFLTPNPPEKKVYAGPFFGVLSQEMRHINFFLGAQNGVFRVGCKKVMLKKLMCSFCSLSMDAVAGGRVGVRRGDAACCDHVTCCQSPLRGLAAPSRPLCSTAGPSISKRSSILYGFPTGGLPLETKT